MNKEICFTTLKQNDQNTTIYNVMEVYNIIRKSAMTVMILHRLDTHAKVMLCKALFAHTNMTIICVHFIISLYNQHHVSYLRDKTQSAVTTLIMTIVYYTFTLYLLAVG